MTTDTASGPTDPCDDSRLCQEIHGETAGIAFHELCAGDPPSRVVHETEHFAVMADLAPLVEGHVLLVPKWHAISVGQVPDDRWGELSALVAATIRVITDAYGAPLVLEHGSSSAGTFSACVSHAHLHFLPIAADFTGTLRADGLEGEQVDGLEALRTAGAADESYVFYWESATGARWLYRTGLSKRHQYLRMVAAEFLGIPDPEWDWAQVQRLDLLRATVERLRQAQWTT